MREGAAEGGRRSARQKRAAQQRVRAAPCYARRHDGER